MSHETIWEQFVKQKDKWIGGTLVDLDDEFGEPPAQTEITDIVLFELPNQYGCIWFEVIGKDYGCGFNTGYGGIKGWWKHQDFDMVLGTAYGSFAIRKPKTGESK